MTSHMISLLLSLALSAPQTPWVPADIGDQGCGPEAHRHAFLLDKYGQYVVNREKGEPDIVFDGRCHDNSTEAVTDNDDRKVLPVPNKKQ